MAQAPFMSLFATLNVDSFWIADSNRRSTLPVRLKLETTMQMIIRNEQGTLDPSTRTRAERRLGFALGRFANRIRTVRLVLTDQNGPRGGLDKLCTVQVRGAGWSVHIEDVDADAGVAVDRAADRAGRSVARKLDRLRDQTG